MMMITYNRGLIAKVSLVQGEMAKMAAAHEYENDDDDWLLDRIFLAEQLSNDDDDQ